MGPFILAWLVGEGIISYRAVKAQGAPPGPGQLLLTSGIFVLLGFLAESQKARPLAITLAWGFNAAALLKLFPLPKQGIRSATPWPPNKAPDTVIIPLGDIVYNKNRQAQLGVPDTGSVNP